MKYYQITNSTELKDIGFYPQTIIKNGTTIYDENPNYDQNFIEKGRININSKSKLTNLIAKSPISHGLIVDRKLKEIFSDYKIPAYNFYKIPTEYNNNDIDYFWLKFVSSERYIDYKYSEFEILNISGHSTIGKLQFKSIDFYHRISNALIFEESQRISKLVLKEGFPDNDLISFSKIFPGEFVSEKLRDRLISEKVTGIELVEDERITMHNNAL